MKTLRTRVYMFVTTATLINNRAPSTSRKQPSFLVEKIIKILTLPDGLGALWKKKLKEYGVIVVVVVSKSEVGKALQIV